MSIIIEMGSTTTSIYNVYTLKNVKLKPQRVSSVPERHPDSYPPLC